MNEATIKAITDGTLVPADTCDRAMVGVNMRNIRDTHGYRPTFFKNDTAVHDYKLGCFAISHPIPAGIALRSLDFCAESARYAMA